MKRVISGFLSIDHITKKIKALAVQLQLLGKIMEDVSKKTVFKILWK